MTRAGDNANLISYRSGERVEGVYHVAGTRGGGFVIPDDPMREDLRVLPRDSGIALHRDRVSARVIELRRNRQPKGEILDVLTHANRRMAGRIARRGRKCVVIPHNQKIRRLVEIQREFPRSEVPDGAWVIVEIREWSDSPDYPLMGKLVEVLGVEGDPGLTVLLILRDYDVATEFSAEALGEANDLAEGRVKPEDPPRTDFRNERIVTIDPATAKDFDDAIGLIGKRPEGWRIGVHIADVAHYVRPGGALNDEAYGRATSIYPIDRVVPMLPEALSNNICSLVPDEDRNVMSAMMTVTPEGEIRDVELANGRIRSCRRFAYEEIQGLFNRRDIGEWASDPDGGPPPGKRPLGWDLRGLPIPDVDPELMSDLVELREAARAIRRERDGRGALNLDLPEPEILFDGEGHVSGIQRRPHFEAHMLVEDFMIAANEAVARALTDKKFPVLYRVHEEPDEGKLATLAPVLKRFGIRLPLADVDQATLQAALEKAKRHPAGRVVQRWVLRAMMRARYQPDNAGHYGLASACYLHFTSPIRRYPDLIVHRAVKAILAGEKANSKSIMAMREAMPEAGRHCTAREERSQKIEWDAEERLGLEYMQRFTGEVVKGFISGCAPIGCYVELDEYPVEGLIHYRNLSGDYYDFDDHAMCWRGRSTGRTFSLGDPVMAMIERVEPMAGKMDLKLVRGEGAPPKKGKGKKGGKAKLKAARAAGKNSAPKSGRKTKTSKRSGPKGKKKR